MASTSEPCAGTLSSPNVTVTVLIPFSSIVSITVKSLLRTPFTYISSSKPSNEYSFIVKMRGSAVPLRTTSTYVLIT